MRDDLDQEIKTSAVENPITIAKLSRLEKILLELEVKVTAKRMEEWRENCVVKVDGDRVHC